ncbi:hypothetical protein D3C87_233840 [compost metagenome]
MKTLFSLATLAVLTLASCKKEYTCECKTTINEPGYSFMGSTYPPETTTSSSSRSIRDKQDKAKTNCEEGSRVTSSASPYASMGQDSTTTTIACAIK